MSSYKDIELECVRCHKSFLFTARDQQFWDENNYTEQPKRCKDCRMARRREKEQRGE